MKVKINIIKYVSLDFENKLKTILTPKRYSHVLSVVKYSIYLAEKYRVNKKKTIIASLLHDCAKDLEKEKIKYYLTKYKKYIPEDALKIKPLWHSFVGPFVAKELFNVRDKDILLTIKYHSTGHKDFSKIGKIVFIADYIADDRRHSDAQKLRKLITKDKISLNYLTFLVLQSKISYLVFNNFFIFPSSIGFYNELLKKVSL